MHKQFFRRITWVLIAAGVAIGAYVAVRRSGSSRWIAEITLACCNTPCGEAASRGGVDVRQTSTLGRNTLGGFRPLDAVDVSAIYRLSL